MQSAVAHAGGVGREAATREFNDPAGRFVEEDLYIFAYSMNGTTLALPHEPELIGTNRLGFLDHYGVAVVAWEIEVARAGGGFVYVVYPNPGTGSGALKLCYVVPVDGEWFVGSGVYGTGRKCEKPAFPRNRPVDSGAMRQDSSRSPCRGWQ